MCFSSLSREDAGSGDYADNDHNIDIFDDTEAASEESEEALMIIKAENIYKCDKCLKPNYKHQHTGFCGKCVTNGHISAQQELPLSTTIRCSKCGITVFQSQHVMFCWETCGGED